MASFPAPPATELSRPKYEGLHSDPGRPIQAIWILRDFDEQNMDLRIRSLISLLLSFHVGASGSSFPVQDQTPEAGVQLRQLLENLESGRFSGDCIDLVVTHGSLQGVFAQLERASGLRMSLSPSLDDTVTYRMMDVPWDEALATVLSDHSLQIGPDSAWDGFKIGRGQVVVLGLSDPGRARIILFLYRHLAGMVLSIFLLVIAVPVGLLFHRRRLARRRAGSGRALLLPEEVDRAKRRLFHLLEGERIYRRENATLTLVAERMALSTHQLSWLLNQEIGQTFSSLINGYRVREVQSRLSDPSQNHAPLLQIAFDVGFNSKASFNRAFKKATGMTPSEFKKTVSE